MGAAKVFCLEESVWWREEGLGGRTSVLPTLELLERLKLIAFIHRYVRTRAEFDEYLRFRRAKHRAYGVIYLAFHGTRQGLDVGNDSVGLSELATGLGTCKGAVVHLGSCSVLKDNADGAANFLAATGARALSGFAREVDWVESAAFEQILFSYLAHYSAIGTALRYIEERHEGLVERLQWACFDSTVPTD